MGKVLSRKIVIIILILLCCGAEEAVVAAQQKSSGKSTTVSRRSKKKRRARRPVRIVAEPFEPKPDYTVHGIDVSKHMGEINWDKIAEQDIDFAIVKATEGATYVDPMYETYMNGARQAGLPVGAYHFFRFERSAEEQLDNFIKHVDVPSLDIPPVFDLEEARAINRPGDIDTIIPKVDHFLREIERRYNVKMLIYVNVKDYNKYIRGRYEDFPLWICSLRDTAAINDKWVLWQYSHRTKVEGIRYPVDMNVFHGTREQWWKMLENTRLAYRFARPKCYLEEYRFVKNWKDVYFVRNMLYIQGINPALE